MPHLFVHRFRIRIVFLVILTKVVVMDLTASSIKELVVKTRIEHYFTKNYRQLII